MRHLNLLEWQRGVPLHIMKAITESILLNRLITVARYVYIILSPLETSRERLAKKICKFNIKPLQVLGKLLKCSIDFFSTIVIQMI